MHNGGNGSNGAWQTEIFYRSNHVFYSQKQNVLKK
jgi:hypothetical protein